MWILILQMRRIIDESSSIINLPHIDVMVRLVGVNQVLLLAVVEVGIVGALVDCV
jgi:hypothetical protein